MAPTRHQQGVANIDRAGLRTGQGMQLSITLER